MRQALVVVMKFVSTLIGSPSKLALLALLTGFAVSGHSEIFFQDGFESGDKSFTQNGVRWADSNSVTVNTANPKSGSYGMQMRYWATPNNEDSWSEQRFSLGGNYPDIWVSYDMHIPANYNHRTQSGSANNKAFLYMWSGNYGSPNGPMIGPEFWPNGDGTSNASMRVFGPGLDRHIWDACPVAIKSSDAGKWVKIIAHYKYASSSNNDGIAQIWKVYADGSTELTCNVTNGAWYVAGARGFDQGYLLGWSNSGFNEDTSFQIDNIVMSTTSLLPGTAAAPMAPTGLTVVLVQ